MGLGWQATPHHRFLTLDGWPWVRRQRCTRQPPRQPIDATTAATTANFIDSSESTIESGADVIGPDVSAAVNG